ncbi:ABC transporter ATP-binding protein [Vineibacter terrae]|uniref:ABC transporter ATP-binding protein n=1 Tax=Vineibacter terrae TaxID=2586908 RepID=UPI002E32B929|nr:ABC transporter ATP-binding protein [Vineibacter terrae]HEX2891178.1 ABC transporter ATP-binding protein [Vineibacter terrae]
MTVALMPRDGSRGSTASVTIDRIEKRFGDHWAVRPTSFDIPAGTLTTLVGPSGSGKTTILKMIAGFEEPSGGRILVSGVDVTRTAPHRRDVGFVFQQYALFPHLTVFANVAYPLKMRRVAAAEIRARVADALSMVRLEGMDKRYPSQLSGGQQQRVALARAIVFHPPILLMDEPMSALDKRLRDEMQYEIRNLQQKLGITTVAVTHDQTEALVMSDMVIVLNKGAVEQIGHPHDVYKKPRSEFVATFIGESNILRGQVVEHDGQPWLEAEGRPRLRLAADAMPSVGKPVTYIVRPESIAIGPPAPTAVGVTGTVAEVSFVGDVQRVRIEPGWGAPLVAKVQCRQGMLVPRTGEQVEAAWSTDDASMIF